MLSLQRSSILETWPGVRVGTASSTKQRLSSLIARFLGDGSGGCEVGIKVVKDRGRYTWGMGVGDVRCRQAKRDGGSWRGIEEGVKGEEKDGGRRRGMGRWWRITEYYFECRKRSNVTVTSSIAYECSNMYVLLIP